MRIWDRKVRELMLRLDGAQFDFLNCQLTGSYLLILVELFRARQEEIKLELGLAEQARNGRWSGGHPKKSHWRW